MSVEHWNALLNIVTNIDYLAIPVAFLVLRNLREPDVPHRVLLSRILFVLLCGAHHGVMAWVLTSGDPIWGIRTTVNAAMAIVSCWALLEHVLWARTRHAPVPAAVFEAERERAAALAESNNELRRFAYVASHDLQEPLRMIASYAQLLDRRYRDTLDEDGVEFLGYVVDGSERLHELINDLLELSRVESDGTPAEDFDADAAVADALGGLETSIKERGARIVVHPLPRARGHRRHVTQVFQNLIGNALKYHDGPAPMIEIGAEEREDGSVFWVRDDGIGIDPEHHRRIFEVFHRLHSRDAYEGTGIGLALCRRMIEREGGRIWVESARGMGSTFYFTLPGATSQASSAGVPLEPARTAEPHLIHS